MERLFNKYGVYTEEAQKISKKITKYVEEIVQENIDKYDPIDIQHLLSESIDFVCATTRMKRSVAAKRAERAEKEKQEKDDENSTMVEN